MTEEKQEPQEKVSILKKLKINNSTDVEIPEKAMTSVVIAGKVVLPLEGLIDMDKEISRLEKELAKLQSELDRVDKKLS
ncbi:hypothetical protein JGE88_23925, partial [Salmonella enterica subsp. enterica serovar Indiana]|nr:hypothetical protein [Salmonella enterica subsp. enterica serovar Indiana]